MSKGVLRYTMVVRHPDTAESTALMAGEPVPAWASDLVQPDDLDGADAKSSPAKKTAARKSSDK